MNEQSEIEQAVARGALLLDELFPGWMLRITKKLVMSSPCHCILGQLYGGYDQGKQRVFGQTLSSWMCSEESVSHGFDVSSNHLVGGPDMYDRYHLLEYAWIAAIQQRKEAANG
jgi:hypothetical protein